MVLLDYPVEPVARYGFGKPAHPELSEIIARHVGDYCRILEEMLQFRDSVLAIPLRAPPDSPTPRWLNGYLPALDSLALYAFVRVNRPHTYLEIGSGNSTKFARKAISDQALATSIVSIDPHPRAEIDDLCDVVIRSSLESCDLSVFDRLRAGDIVFFDGSHRVFMNSDVTVFFLEVLPRLAPGVLVQIHDICLPLDYPPSMSHTFYSEQYLLAAILLAGASTLEIVLPARFVSETPLLRSILNPLWDAPLLRGVETHGASFWVRTREKRDPAVEDRPHGVVGEAVGEAKI
jgi:hypothetical protein